MSYSKLDNDLQTREHMREMSICSHKEGSSATIPSVILIDNTGNLVYQLDTNTYSVNNHTFTIVDNLFTCEDLSILLPPKRETNSVIESLYLGLGYSFEVEAKGYDIDITDTDIISIVFFA